jgi:hypothetical protein
MRLCCRSTRSTTTWISSPSVTACFRRSNDLALDRHSGANGVLGSLQWIGLAGAHRQGHAAESILARGLLNLQHLDVDLIAHFGRVLRPHPSAPGDLAHVNQAIEPIAEVDQHTVVPDLDHFALELFSDLERGHPFARLLPSFLFEDVPPADDDALLVAALVRRQRELAALAQQGIGIVDVRE